MPILYFVIWIILNGRVTAEIVLFGIAVSACITLFTTKVLGYSIRNDLLILRKLPLFVVYILNLIVEIVKASLAVTKAALSPAIRPDPVVIEFHSGLPGTFRNVLLANSITLTPGTYTLLQKGDYFRVHCLKPEYAEGMAESSFVKILRRI